MFGLLKDKLSGFVNKLIKREEDKPPAAASVPQPAPAAKEAAPAPISPPPTPVSSPPPKKHEEKKPEPKREEKRSEPKREEKKAEPKHEEKKHVHEEKKPIHKEEEKKHEHHQPEKKKEEIHVHKKAEHVEPKKIETPIIHAAPKQIIPEPKPIIPEVKPIIAQPKPIIAAPEPKKDILSGIWPFGKKEEKPTSAPKPVTVEQKTSPIPATSPIQITKPASAAHPVSAPKPDIQLQVPDSVLEQADLTRLEKKSLSDDEREMKVKVGIGKSVLGFLSPQVTIEENDVRDLLDDLELALLESDVALEVSTEVTARLKKKLVGLKVQKGQMQQEVQKQMHQVLADIMTSTNSFDFLERVQQKPKPVKILFVGPNGAGKTTTMAKIAQRLLDAKMTVVFAAGDTFRAAAIEQTEVHAKRLGIPVIKSKYGADPASVAFDAVNYAKAHKTDVVLIDSAGRQDTNANLLDELKKINRVITPDLKIYIGESIGGHALVEQIRGFHEAIGIDGAILTKLDCDAKGGTAISLTYATKVPILFLGTGQKYEDLKAFDAEWVAGQILGGEAG